MFSVALKQAVPHVYIGQRRLGHHGLFANLHCVDKIAALRLCDSGAAKLLPHLSLARLRVEVADLGAGAAHAPA